MISGHWESEMKDKKKLDTEETRGNVPHLKDIYKKRYGSGWETQYKKDVDWVIKYLTGIENGKS